MSLQQAACAAIDDGIVAIGGDSPCNKVDRLPRGIRPRVRHHRLEPDTVGEIEIDDRVGAVVGDPVNPGNPSPRAMTMPSTSGRTARTAGPSGMGNGSLSPARVNVPPATCPSTRFIVPMKPATKGVAGSR